MLCLLSIAVPSVQQAAAPLAEPSAVATEPAQPRFVKRKEQKQRREEARLLEENLQRARLAAGKSRVKSKFFAGDNLVYICIGVVVAILLLLMILAR